MSLTLFSSSRRKFSSIICLYVIINPFFMKIKIYYILNKSSNKFIFVINMLYFFLFLFPMYIKMSENLSAKYYQENKKRLQKESL